MFCRSRTTYAGVFGAGSAAAGWIEAVRAVRAASAVSAGTRTRRMSAPTNESGGGHAPARPAVSGLTHMHYCGTGRRGVGSKHRSHRRCAMAAEFRGTTIGPADAGYDEARSVFNAMIDRKPDRIMRCSSAEDVAAAIASARADGLPLSVYGGGHGVTGAAVVDGG